MNSYTADIFEIWVVPYLVEAESLEEARAILAAGGGSRQDGVMEYIEKLDSPADFEIELA